MMTNTIMMTVVMIVLILVIVEMVVVMVMTVMTLVTVMMMMARVPTCTILHCSCITEMGTLVAPICWVIPPASPSCTVVLGGGEVV